MRYLVDKYGIPLIYPYPMFMQGNGWYGSLESAKENALIQSKDYQCKEHRGSFICVFEFEDTGHYGNVVGVAIDGLLFNRETEVQKAVREQLKAKAGE